MRDALRYCENMDVTPRPAFRFSVFGTVLVVFLIAGAFTVGLYVGFHKSDQLANISAFAGSDAVPPAEVDFSPLWKAWSVLDEKFVPATTTEEVSREDQLWGLIQGLASSLGDPYTVFMPPAKATTFEEDIRGEFGGVGIEIGMRDKILTVISPLKGTPADKAGILAGDKIVKIDGKTTEHISVDEAVTHIRGEIGTDVVLTIAREGLDAFKDFTLTRAKIEVPTIDTELRSDGVFVVKLYNFTATSPNLFRDALREFVESKSNKLVLDLRGNPGGYLEAAVDMASFFLPAGKTVVTEDYGKNGDPRIHRSKGYNIFEKSNLKMIILVNQGSASASEILAGALQQHGIAQLVGQATFGKGSVQELVKITPETSLKVTVARWLTPNGTSISDGGVKPDFEVAFEAKDVEAGVDPQLEKAVGVLKGL